MLTTGESRTTVIILWCDRRENVERFLLECLQGGGRAEQRRTQDCGCLGDWHRQWCSKIGGSCWRDSWLSCQEGQRCWSCVHVGHRRVRVRSGESADPGTVDGKVRGLNMRVAPVKKSLTSVYDMFAAGHRVVFDFDDNTRDLSHAENKLTGERTFFKLRNRVWEFEVKIILRRNRGHPDENASAKRRGVVYFRGSRCCGRKSRGHCGFWTCSRRPRVRGSRRHGRGDRAPRRAR